MSVLVLQDATIELSTGEDTFLKEVGHLTLEVSINGRVVKKTNLVSTESNPGLWKADPILLIPEVAADFMISVVMESDKNQRQTVAFTELRDLESSNMRNRHKIPLISHQNYPNLVLKTSTMAIQNLQELPARFGSNDGQEGGLSHRKDTIGKTLAEAETAYVNFERHGKLESLEQAILHCRNIIEDVPKDDPRLPETLNLLGIALLNRFGQLGHLEDLKESIDQHETAVLLTPNGNSDKYSRLSNLGNALFIRFERLGNLEDLNNAIRQQRETVDFTTADDPNKPAYLNNLANCLQIRFNRFGNVDDLKDAIVQRQKAVDATLAGDPDKPSRLINLGSSIYARFLYSGDIADIDGAIAQMALAVSLTSDDHPNKSDYLSNLGGCLHDRFERLGNFADLNNAILRQQQAASLIPNSHQTKPLLLNNLGSSFITRFDLLGNGADIDSAILQHQEAVNLLPAEHPDLPMYLSNLGAALNKRFNRFGNPGDIDGAIAHIQRAIDLTPDDRPNKSSCLTNLAAFLGNRFRRVGNPADLDRAIENQQKALELTPKSHRNRSSRLLNLAMLFVNRVSRSLNPSDAKAAILHLSGASSKSSGGAPIDHFKAAEQWIEFTSIIKHSSLLSAYERALELMPLVAWLGLPIADRHQHLIKIGGISRDAAAAAISAGKYDKALEWLEHGRSIVWTQILQLLKASRLLDNASPQPGLSSRIHSSMEEEGRKYRALTAEWESIIKQVRSLSGFDDFLRPPNSSRLKMAAQSGPIVIVNMAEKRCDALALRPGLENVIHIPLPNITSKEVTKLRDQLKHYLHSSGIRMRNVRATERDKDDADRETCRRVLADLWIDLVKPVLDSLALAPHPDVLPRIWWCTTGPLAFLPIHAAGIYGPDPDDLQISNYAISSYIPTVSTLLEPAKCTVTLSFNLLSVIQPFVPRAAPIPNTKKELEYIRQRLVDRDHVVLEGSAGTMSQVKEKMKDCNWLHLACHGTQKATEPTKSALLLDDGDLTLEEIIKLDLPHAELAFLSACQTTTGDESLSEEAVHIAGGMLLAGYRSVVATMWSIQDGLAPKVTDEFYGHILKEGERPDPRKAAEALHMSVQKLRQQPGVELTDWIPFVHLGV
ncbi:TPR-like protein [Serendipita vermifera]|nr:TPR-like protein [Serendipita vermifera]